MAAKKNKTKQRANVARYKNPAFLKRLGEHCGEVRRKKGYSMDRMAREGTQLSRGTIHRLEKGQGDTHITALLRYAVILGIPLKKLLDFAYDDLIDEN